MECRYLFISAKPSIIIPLRERLSGLTRNLTGEHHPGGIDLRATQYYAPTLRQAPAEAEIPSHKLLVRGGFIRPLTSGVFTYLPLGLRVLHRAVS